MTHRIGPRTMVFALLVLSLAAPAFADIETDTRNNAETAPSLVPEGYLDADALSGRLQELAEAHPDAVGLRSIATTTEGRDVWLVTLGVQPIEDEDENEDDDTPRPPAVLIVANLEADHLIGSQVALGLVERLADPGDDDEPIKNFLGQHTLYVVPRLNPDGAERLFVEPRWAIRTNLTPTDEDRDGAFDEDGPDDVDGDGLILRMRAKDADATLVPDADDPRILRPARAAEGERAVYSESDEGTDLDGDGERNEDPPGGVNLNRNWPHNWTEFNDTTGDSPASEPEVHALIQFCYDRPELAVIWTFTLHDSLRTEPKKPDSTLDDADLPYFAELSKVYREIVSPPRATTGESDENADDDSEAMPDADADADADAEPADAPKEPIPAEAPIADGDDPLAFLPDEVRNRLMAAFEALPDEEQQRRIDAFLKASPLGRTQMVAQFLRQIGEGEGEPEPADEPKDAATGARPTADGSSPTSASALGATTDGAMSEWAYHQFGAVGLASSLWPEPPLPEPAEGEKTPPADGEARWLFWNDQVMDGRAFVPFREVEHPTLGTVEVGGWMPGVRINPPIEQVEAITDAQHRFLGELAGRLPALSIADVKAEARGGGLFEVTARVENSGTLPTALAQGVTTRQAAPVLVRPKLGDAKLLAGPLLGRIDALAGSGGSKEFRWLILAPEGVDSIELDASCPRAGRVVETIELR